MPVPPSRRCRFAEASGDDLEDIEQVYAANAGVLGLRGSGAEARTRARRLLSHESLPSDVDPRDATTVVVRCLEDDSFVGILALLHQHPVPSALHIGGLHLLPCIHRQGFGEEIVHHLLTLASAWGYRTLHASVDLQNAGALRFWSAMKFVRVPDGTEDHSGVLEPLASIALVHEVQNS